MSFYLWTITWRLRNKTLRLHVAWVQICLGLWRQASSWVTGIGEDSRQSWEKVLCDHPHYRSCLRESSSRPRFGCAPCMDSHSSLDVCGCAISAASCIAHLLLHVASGRMAQSSNVFIHGCTINSAQGGIYINNEYARFQFFQKSNFQVRSEFSLRERGSLLRLSIWWETEHLSFARLESVCPNSSESFLLLYCAFVTDLRCPLLSLCVEK